jgi:hypothetical protein
MIAREVADRVWAMNVWKQSVHRLYEALQNPHATNHMWLAQLVCTPQFFKTPSGLCGQTVYLLPCHLSNSTSCTLTKFNIYIYIYFFLQLSLGSLSYTYLIWGVCILLCVWYHMILGFNPSTQRRRIKTQYHTILYMSFTFQANCVLILEINSDCLPQPSVLGDYN